MSGRKNLREGLVALGCGGLLGAGLAVSGLTRPEVVLGFLDVTGQWDPTLGIVMAIALALNALAVASTTRRRRPLWAARFDLPTPTRIDRRMLAGSAVFGIGWGLVGVCPGPALASLGSGATSVFTFVGAMTAGIALVDVVLPLKVASATRKVAPLLQAEERSAS